MGTRRANRSKQVVGKLIWRLLLGLGVTAGWLAIGDFCRACAAEFSETAEAKGRSRPTFAPASAAERRRLREVVREAFLTARDGWSTDEVLLNDALNRRFLDECRKRLPEADPTHCNWALLNLRKSGALRGVRTTKRRHDRHDDYWHAAEIAARFLQDKYELSIDRVLCCPQLREEFDRVARSVAPDVEPYRLRKAALGLRKARRLRPELVVRIADWDRRVLTFPAEQVVKNPDLVPEAPGVYIFRDRTGYLYIGESSDLRRRVAKHLDHSDRKSLARYLWKNGLAGVTVEVHAFDPTSKAKERLVRRAYESELIRSRKPRFNIAP